MIDHFERRAQEMLIDELDAVSPSLATWAASEFDVGTSTAAIRRALFDASPEATQLASRSSDLAAAIQFDENGVMIGGHLQGGNGGLLSRETIHKAGLVQLTLNDINKLPAPGKEG